MAHESCKSQIAVLEMNEQSVPQRWTSMRKGSNTARRQCSAWDVELSPIRRANVLASRESGYRVAHSRQVVRCHHMETLEHLDADSETDAISQCKTRDLSPELVVTTTSHRFLSAYTGFQYASELSTRRRCLCRSVCMMQPLAIWLTCVCRPTPCMVASNCVPRRLGLCWPRASGPPPVAQLHRQWTTNVEQSTS